MGEYDPHESNVINQKPSDLPIKPEGTSPLEDEGRGLAEESAAEKIRTEDSVPGHDVQGADQAKGRQRLSDMRGSFRR